MFGILIALLSGALMSVQGVFNTEVTKNTSLWVSTCFVQFSALAVCLVAWFFADRQSFSTLLEVPNKYALLGLSLIHISSGRKYRKCIRKDLQRGHCGSGQLYEQYVLSLIHI